MKQHALKTLSLVSTTRLSVMLHSGPVTVLLCSLTLCAHHPLLGKYLSSPNSTPSTEPVLWFNHTSPYRSRLLLQIAVLG